MAEQTLPDQIAIQLRRDILRGKLLPGAPIKERDSAAEMGVSRTPMREAIRILAKEGLIDLRPSRSPIVADPSFGEISDAIEVLRALEMLSGELACKNASNEEISVIHQIHIRMEKLYDRLDKLDLFELDMEFHIAIAKASHNQVLAETHNAFLARLWRARYLAASQRRNRERVLSQHSAILEGLETRNITRVQATIGYHLASMVDNIRHLFDPQSSAPKLPPSSEQASADIVPRPEEV